MSKILIVEDDIDISSIEADYLELSNFNVDIESDGLKGYEMALNNNYDLIILDVMLPNMNGFEICRSLREKMNIPILMVTARSNEIDIIRGLGYGADDYIEKPFSPSVLVARVKAHLMGAKRRSSNITNFIEIDNIRLDIETHQVFKNNLEIKLKNKEFELLKYLMINRNHVYSKDELYEKIWGLDSLGDNATVTVHINRLREKLEDNPNNPKHLLTIWGVGYSFK